MPASAIGPALATLFTPAAAGAAGAGAAAGAFQGFGLSLLGGVVSGIGQAKMAEKEMKERERQRIAEEDRLKATYEGSGDAVGTLFDPGNENDATQGQKYERADPMSNAGLAVGQREERMAPGAKYRMSTPQKPRYKYNPQSGRIEQG